MCGIAACQKNQLIRTEMTWARIRRIFIRLTAIRALRPIQPIKHLWNGAKNLISNIQRDDLEPTVAAFKDPIRAKVLDCRI